MSKKTDYEKRTAEFIQPILEELGFSLYDLEYVKEAGEYFLRAYIDKPDGITIDDCVTVSRRMNEILDREDYIADAYTFEVSSPGIERRLRTDQHFKGAVGELVRLKLYAAKDGKKEWDGILKEAAEDTVVLDCEGTEMTIPKSEIASAHTVFDG
ncbi:MAG: ribosome maturation factor RimP [Lachnospiraceae bacterium]|nr:ribosome maturation factor RimP [Lachnospiraceae bacterium]